MQKMLENYNNQKIIKITQQTWFTKLYVCVSLQVRKEYGRCLRSHCCSGKSVESTISTSTKTSTARTPGRYSTNSQVTHTHLQGILQNQISSDFSRPVTGEAVNGQCSHQLVISLHRKHFSSGVFLFMDEYSPTWPNFPFSLILNGALSILLTSLFVNIIRKVFNAIFQLAISHSTVPITVDKKGKQNQPHWSNGCIWYKILDTRYKISYLHYTTIDA